MSFFDTQFGAVKFYGPAILPLSSSPFGTHVSQYGIGGFQELPDINTRNSIPIAEEMNADGVSSGRRKLGMMVYTLEEGRFFQLVPLSSNGTPVSFTDWNAASDAQKMVWLNPEAVREDIYGASPTFALISGTNNPNDCWREILFNAGLPVVGNFLPLSGGTVTGDLTVDGSFMVNGSATFVNSTNLVIEDPLIFIAQNNPANLVDMGIVGQFINSPTQFTGLVRDHQTNEWYLFSGLSGVELTATDLDFTDPALKIDTLRANLIGDILSSTRVFGTLSASGDVYGNNLHWSEWDSTWTTVSANSAIWGQNVTDLQLLSSNWQSTYTTVSANSATWVQNVIDLQSLSGNWQSTYTSVRDLSSNWESTYTTVSANSARWESAFYSISSTIFQEGNSFGKSVVIGSNDPYSLVFETSGIPRVTILSGGNVGIGTTNPNYSLTVIGDVSANAIRLTSSTAATLGIQFGTDTNLYRPGANRLKTDDVFECSLPANTTSNTVLVQAAANNAINARSVSPTLWTVGDTVAGLSAVWNSTTTTVSANSATWGQNVTDLRALSGNWQSTYTTVSANSATWGQNVTDLQTLSGNWQSTYTTVSANSATWVRNVTDLQTLSGNWQSTYLSVKDLSGNWESTYTTVSANSARWETAFYATSSTIFQKGNSFGEAVVIGSNDPYSLVFETSGTPRVTILSGGNVGIGTTNPNYSLTVIGDVSANAIRLVSSTASTLGIQFGTDTNLYRPGANRLKTDDVFECSLPANTTSNTVLVQAAANNAVNARSVSPTLWTVGDTVAGLSAIWNSTYTTVSSNSATWGQSVTDLRSLSGNWQSTYTTVLSNSATWVQNVTDLQTLSGNWQSTYTTISTNSATWVQNVTDLQTLSGNWQSTYTTVEANSSDWGLAFASLGNYLPLSGGTVNGDLFVNGNLVITGSSALISSTNIAIKDSLIYLGYDNPSDSLDIGFIGSFTEGLVGYQHTGLVRLYDTNEWALFSGLTSEPFSATSISRTDPTFSINTLNANIKGNILSSTNVFGSLSSNNLLYDVAGNSSLWNSTYTTVRSNSASWGRGVTDLNSLSSNWQSTYTTVLANSASWTNLRSLSGNWQSTYTTVLANSASWTNLRSLSGNWQSTYTTVSANSASWGQSATDLKSLSGNWQSTYTTVSANSATWSQNVTDLQTLSGNWQSTYTTVSANSGFWGQNVTDLQALSGNWESTYTTVSANSARWESAYFSISSTIRQQGNSFGEAVVIGSNDPYSLVFETSGVPRVTILSGGNVGIGTSNPNQSLTVIGDISANAIRLTSSTAATLGIQFGTDTNLYRPGANRLKTDDVFECSLPANTTSNTVLVQAAANNAINARAVSSTLWTVGDTVAGLSAVWNSTTTTVSANSAVWTQGITALTTLSGNWQSTYLTVSALSADWNDGTSEVVIARVFNADAVPLVRGHVVYTFGAQGDTMSVKLASNTSEATSSKTLGIVRDTIPVGLYGYVTLFGSMDKLNLDSTTFNEGDALWLGSLSGTYTNVKPVAPNHGVYLGVVERANSGNGIAYIKVQNGYELNEIHDVLVTSVSAGQILRRNSLNNLWINVDDAFSWDSAVTTVSANSANWDSAYYSISSAIRQKGNSFGESVVIGSNDRYSLVFETSGVPRVTILSGGNVGIGNSSPNYPLTVTGDISANAIRLTSSTANSFGIQFGTDTNLYRSAANILKTDDSFLPFLSSNGTSSNTVVVAQTTANQVLERRQINPAVWNTTARLITAEALNNFGKNYIPKAATNSSLDNSEIYQENLNIGIGTTTPNEKLTVVGSVSASDYVFSRTKLSFLTDSFTIQLSHQNNLVLCNNTAPISALVPNDSNVMFEVGASINIASLGEKVYVDGYAGVTINAADNRNYLRTTNSTATILKIGANNWLLFGDIWNDTLAN